MEIKIPQPERMLLSLETAENRYAFPEEMIVELDNFTSYVKHCIGDSYSRGFHVINAHVREPTEQDILNGCRILILKVAKLPSPILTELGLI